MTPAILILLSVAVAVLVGMFVVQVRALWPRKGRGCAFLGRPCSRGDCRFWSPEGGACGINLCVRHYLDVEAGSAKTLAKRYGLTTSDE